MSGDSGMDKEDVTGGNILILCFYYHYNNYYLFSHPLPGTLTVNDNFI